MTKNQRRINKRNLIRRSRIFKVVAADGLHGFELGTLVRWQPTDEDRVIEHRNGTMNLVSIVPGFWYGLRQWTTARAVM